MTRILTFDLSLNHAGAVELTDGEMTWHGYYTDHAGTAARSPDGVRFQLPKTADKQYAQTHRLVQIESWVRTTLLARRPEYVGIEGYAYASKQGAHQLGEAGGVARIWFWKFGVKFRIHDPLSIKMYVTHDGTAQKDLIEQKVFERWNVSFNGYNPLPSKAGKRQHRTSEDLADAYGMARLVELEIKLRAGTLGLDDLEHDKERQVFNRVTKTFPVSLLGREWICNSEGGYPGLGVKKVTDGRLETLRRAVQGHRKLILKLMSG